MSKPAITGLRRPASGRISRSPTTCVAIAGTAARKRRRSARNRAVSSLIATGFTT